MADNIFLYTLSSICFLLILIEWICISYKNGLISTFTFVIYSFPLYDLMIHKESGGAAFTWWFYLVVLTSIHVIILLINILKFFHQKKM